MRQIWCRNLAALLPTLLLFASPAVHAQVNTFDVSGLVYNDLNGNGSSDGATDPGLTGIEVDLLDASNAVIASTLSLAGGTYSLTGISPGSYKLMQVAQAGWIITQPVGDLYNLTGSAGDNLTGFDFGNFQLDSLSGNIYNDLNGNGQQNGGEPGLSGWTAEVRDAGNNVVASAVSGAGGAYLITGIGPGSFTLHEQVMAGWQITQPTSPDFYSFTTSSGVNIVGGIFGNHAQAVPEPGALALLAGLAVPGMAFAIRRRG